MLSVIESVRFNPDAEAMKLKIWCIWFFLFLCVSHYMHRYLYFVHYELGPIHRCKSGRKNIFKGQWAFLSGNYWYHSFLLSVSLWWYIYVIVLVAISVIEYVKLSSCHLQGICFCVLYTNNNGYT
jgi:hypothetical protein